MDFITYVKNAERDAYDACDRNALQRIGRALDRSGVDLKALLTNNDPALNELQPEILARLADLHREYSRWKEAAKALRRSLAMGKLTIPDGALQFAFIPNEVEALERTARICQRSGYAGHDAWLSAFKAHIELWRASVSLALKDGFVTIRLKEPDHPDAEEFAGVVSARNSLLEMPGYKWLAARRGERAGILEIEFDLPWKTLEAQTEARLSLLGLAAEKRGAKSIVDELISIDLETTLLQTLLTNAEKEALISARSAYLGLLNTPPLQANKAISVFVDSGDKPTGVAILDRRGDIITNIEIPSGDDHRAAIAKVIAEHDPDAAVLPIQGSDQGRFKVVEEALGALPTQRVHDIALAEACKNLSLSRASASAVVLARRTLKPGREWGRVDPLSLRLGEYTRELDPDLMRDILSEARALSSWDRRNRNKTTSRKAKGRLSTLSSGKRLNPFLKSMRDLKPGMSVDGIITNLTRFGAFVNIGLPTEGMIHVSQLSLEFVEDPSQVVRIGEQVKARVLEVVPEKQRIALSLKPAPESLRHDLQSASSPAETKKMTRQAPKSRSAALADLDALFKK